MNKFDRERDQSLRELRRNVARLLTDDSLPTGTEGYVWHTAVRNILDEHITFVSASRTREAEEPDLERRLARIEKRFEDLNDLVWESRT